MFSRYTVLDYRTPVGDVRLLCHRTGAQFLSLVPMFTLSYIHLCQIKRGKYTCSVHRVRTFCSKTYLNLHFGYTRLSYLLMFVLSTIPNNSLKVIVKIYFYSFGNRISYKFCTSLQGYNGNTPKRPDISRFYWTEHSFNTNSIRMIKIYIHM